MSAPTKRAIEGGAAIGAAIVAQIAKHLGPCELVAVLPRRSPRRTSGVITPEIKGSDDPQCRLFPAIAESTR